MASVKPMPLRKVTSSNILALAGKMGKGGTGAVQIQFTSGKVYHYDGVKEEDWKKVEEASRGAGSVGQAFAQFIRPKYKGVVVQVEEDE